MLSSGKRVLTLALVMAANALIGRGAAALHLPPRQLPKREPKANAKKKAKPITSRFTWNRWRVPLGGGAREVARRRRQIEAGTLLTSLGQVRLHASRTLRRGQEQVVYDVLSGKREPKLVGVDMGSPNGDVVVVASQHPTGVLQVLKHTSMGKSEAGPIVLVDAQKP